MGTSVDSMATYRNAISVLAPDALSLCLALLERVLVLELGAHGDESGGEASCGVVWSAT